ncbi:serine/threonine-protein kinase [Frankia sp. R43]|uniref:serine/threonine-protein kinase n=1 Tax=Frankia sp. R43 TaxID=269536 RepID=UPI0007C7D8DF|nr:serine/threonine-protein kinase [Frankia sp. R43]
MAAEADHAVGTRIVGRYQLIEQIGAGGYGTVWRAVDEVLNVTVAAKQLRIPVAASAGHTSLLVTRVMREARMVAKLRDHPHVVTVLDVVEENNLPWIIMEYVPSVSLAEAIRTRGPLSADEVIRIGVAVLDALVAAHQRGISHRDVKPANILIGHDGRIVLVDFGVAAHWSDPTITDGPIGTLAYIAPEQFAGIRQSTAGDLFSLGATMYHAAEGTSAFSRTTQAATIQAVLHDRPQFIRTPGSLAAVIEGFLVKDPAGRLTGSAALAALRGALAAPHHERSEHAGGQPEHVDERPKHEADPRPLSGDDLQDGLAIGTEPVELRESGLRRVLGGVLAVVALAAAAAPWSVALLGDLPAWIGAPAAVWSCFFGSWAVIFGYLFCRPDLLLISGTMLRYRRDGVEHVLTRDQIDGVRVRAGHLEVLLSDPPCPSDSPGSAWLRRCQDRSEPPYLDPSGVLVLCALEDLSGGSAEQIAAASRRFGHDEFAASSTGPALPAAPAAPAAEKLLVDTGLSAGVRPTSRPR